MKIILKSLDIDPTLAFFGSDAEIAEMEQKEKERAEEIRKIIFSPDFSGMSYKTASGQERILTHSIRHGVLFQLSYIDSDGIPSMHENFIKTAKNTVDETIESEEELLRHYVNAGLSEDVELEILTA